VTVKLTVTSPAFKDGEQIPKKYSQYGDNQSPPLDIADIPTETRTLAIIATDLDIPFGLTITHWIIWNIPPAKHLKENTAPGVVGKNSRGKKGYMGPRPPLGTHRYLFEVYALDTALELDSDAKRKEVEEAMQNHMLAKGELTGKYHK
jgi:Raf kinase inhibitor-like YbhB/YbcL family protein